jgi:hypothetical protein
VTNLELAFMLLADDIDSREPLHGRHAIPVGHDEPERRAVICRQRFAVHLVGDHDLGRGVDGVRQVQRANVGDVVVLVVRPVIGTFEQHIHAVRVGFGLREQLVQQYTRPLRGRDAFQPHGSPTGIGAWPIRPFPAHSKVTLRVTGVIARRSASENVSGRRTAPPTCKVPSCSGKAKLLRT